MKGEAAAPRRRHFVPRAYLNNFARRGLRRGLRGPGGCIVPPEVAKHRLFLEMDSTVLPDHTLHVIARDDDYFFGVVQSRVHEVWSPAQRRPHGRRQ